MTTIVTARGNYGNAHALHLVPEQGQLVTPAFYQCTCSLRAYPGQVFFRCLPGCLVVERAWCGFKGVPEDCGQLIVFPQIQRGSDGFLLPGEAQGKREDRVVVLRVGHHRLGVYQIWSVIVVAVPPDLCAATPITVYCSPRKAGGGIPDAKRQIESRRPTPRRRRGDAPKLPSITGNHSYRDWITIVTKKQL